MKKIFFSILTILFFFNLSAQEGVEIDSLKLLIKVTKTDTAKVDLLNKIAKNYYRTSSDSTLKYAIQAYKLSKRIDYSFGKANSYRMIGLGYSGQSDFDKALEFYFLSLDEFKKGGYTDDVGIVLTSIGIVYRKKDEYDKALSYYLQSLDIIKQGNDSAKIASAYTNVGVIYKFLKDYDKALKYHIESLNINRRIANRKGIPYSLGNIALIYKNIGENKKAVLYLKEALLLFEEFNYKNEMAASYSTLGEIYLIQEKFQEAFNSIQRANILYSETGNKAGIAETYIVLANLYLEQEMYSAAEKSLDLGLELSEEINYKDNLLVAYLYHSKLDSTKRNYKEALMYYKKYIQLKDSIFNTERNKAIAEIQAKYDVVEKEKENLMLKKDKEIKDVKIKRQRLLNYFIGSILVLMFFVVFLIIFSYNRLRKANRILITKNEEINSQNASLEEYKEEILTQYEEISLQNEELEMYKNKLEKLVEKRTEELNKALIKAKNSDNLKTKFLENLSHEVRTPMNAISGFSTILSKDKFNFKPEYLYTIYKSMDDLVNTIDRLVIFSKFQLEQYQIHPEKINIIDFFKNVEQMIYERKEFLKKEEIDIDFIIDYKELPDFFKTDEYVMKCIIRELVENAFKFTDKGSITFQTYMQNKNLCLRVRDTGVGIKSDMIKHVYDFMQKFDKDDVLYRGMGVGLALVQKATEIISAEINIESVYKEGAELNISIPEL